MVEAGPSWLRAAGPQRGDGVEGREFAVCQIFRQLSAVDPIDILSVKCIYPRRATIKVSYPL